MFNQGLANILRRPVAVIPDKKVDFKVTVAICTHRDVKVKVFNLLRALENCPNPKIRVMVLEGDALIDRSRSRVATKFLADTKDDVLMFIDDDVLFDTVDVTRLMWDCWRKYDIIGGSYITKDEKDPNFTIRTLTDTEQHTFGKGGETFEVRYLSTGCMAIRRNVLEEMVQKEVVHYCHPDTLKLYPFFLPMEKKVTEKWLYLSEDWAFCERAKSLGFRIWCDSTVRLGHIGPYTYTWDDLVKPKKVVNDTILYDIKVFKE